MKIHMRPPPPLPPAPPPKPLPTFWLETQVEELAKIAQQQTRLKKLYGARKRHQNLGEDVDLEKHELDHHSNRNLDFVV